MGDREILRELWEVIRERAEHPMEGSYVSALLRDPKGIDRVLEKIGEESTEFIIAVKNGDPGSRITEAADLLFHLLVALRASGTEWDDVLAELEKRRRR